ncbi:MAG: hypothetical protein E7400_01645 [Ruminococcaceae bacterium]|nr:hypothetical protein [Oscillospiraceae bacterium]
MKKILSLLLGIVILTAALPCFAQGSVPEPWKTFYVSTEGNDDGTGTENDPFLTITRARDEVRKFNQDMQGDICVYLRGGVYRQADTLTFAPEDSGSNGYYIRYMSYPGEKATISGGKPVTGWKKTENGIWSAPLEGVDYVRTLDVNGRAGRRAQTEEMVPLDEIFAVEDSGNKSDGIITKGGAKYAKYTNPQDIQLFFSRAWKAFLLNVEKIEATGESCRFYMEQPFFEEATTPGPTHYVNPGNRFIMINAFEELDTPGEFYYNRTTKTLYYMPREDENMASAEVEVPVIQTLISVDGEHSGNKVKNLVFDSLTLAHTTWNRGAAHSIVGDQAQWYTPHKDDIKQNPGYYQVPANIILDRAEKIFFTNNVIRDMGAVGIGLVEGVYNCQFTGNVFCDIGDSAMTVGTMDQPYQDKVYKGRDLAHGKFASAANDWTHKQTYISTAAVDGNIKTGYSAEGIGPHWWQVDLGQPWRIHRIEIDDRIDIDNQVARSNFEILGSNDPNFGTYTILGKQGAEPYTRNATATYYVESEEEFRYVRIRKTDVSYLYLAEVRVINEDEEYAPATDQCTDNLIRNNYITRIGLINTGAPGIQAYYTRGLDMSHNTIYDVPYSGLCCGWGWGHYADAVDGRDNSINYNHIEKVMQVSVDGGGIYTLGSQPNSTQIGNYIKNMPNPYGALYGDNSTSYYSYINNVIEDVNIFALCAENGQGTRWQDNWTTATKDMIDTTVNQYVEKPDYFIPGNPPVEAMEVIVNAGLEDGYKDIVEKAGTNWWPRTTGSQFNNLRYDPVFMVDNNLLVYVLRYYIADCRMWLSIAEAGDEVGQYPQEALDAFSAAIEKAAAALKMNPIDRDKVVETRLALIEDVEAFVNSRISYPSERLIQEAEHELKVTKIGTSLGTINRSYYNKLQSILEAYKKNTADSSQHLYLEQYLQHFKESKIDLKISSFSLFNQTMGVEIDHENSIIKVPVQFAAKLNDLVPTIDYRKEGITISPDPSLPQDFNKDVYYTLKTLDGSASKTYTVRAVKPTPIHSESVYSLKTALADTEGWNSFGLYNNSCYTGELFGNVELSFKMKVASRDTYDWPSLVFRSESYDKSFDDMANQAYILCFNPGAIELHRFNNGVRTQFWGPVASAKTIFGGSLQTDAFKYDEENDVKLITRNEADGVRITIIINGETVIDFLDNYEGAITSPGYFGTVSPGSAVVLGAE